MTYRARNILIAAGLAAVAVLLVTMYVANYKENVDLGGKIVKVFVAGTDIEPGTPGAEIVAKDALVEKEVPRKALVPGAISSERQLEGLIATENIYVGEQISTTRFGGLKEKGVLAQLRRNDRAVQVAGDPHQVLDGTIQPGDRVDVVATWNVPEGCDNCHVSRVLLRDLLVMATASTLTTDSGLAAGQDNVPVQLRMTDNEAEKMEWISENGEWRLQLRPVVRPKDSRQGYQNAVTLLREGLKKK
jgi:Flp pilus assembly protein CpaB